MRNKTNKHLGIEVDPVLHFKLHYISKYEGRSANGQILYLIRQCIKNFESENSVIEVPDEIKHLEENTLIVYIVYFSLYCL